MTTIKFLGFWLFVALFLTGMDGYRQTGWPSAPARAPERVSDSPASAAGCPTDVQTAQVRMLDGMPFPCPTK